MNSWYWFEMLPYLQTNINQKKRINQRQKTHGNIGKLNRDQLHKNKAHPKRKIAAWRILIRHKINK